MSASESNKIGLVAHYSEQGDWAFTLAFELARRNDFQLNVFCFPETTYDVPFDNIITGEISREILIQEERKLREYYDRYLEDYLNVGFKLCLRRKHNFDLKSCLHKKDYQTLVIPYISENMIMDEVPIKEFAQNFASPVILVGPQRETQYYLNSPAVLLAKTGRLPRKFNDPLLYEELYSGHGYYVIN